jgi:hypothetical protein
MWKSILLALIAGLAVQESALGEVASADVNIVSVTGALSAQKFSCTVVINNQNDDSSRLTRVIVLMPLQVRKVRGQVSGGPGNCSAAPVVGTFQAYAICELGTLPQGPSVRRTITVTSTPSTAGANYPPSCSAFIYSAVGDIKKTNNYMAWPP